MNNEQIRNERETFIQGYLFGCLKSLKTFDAIKYVKDLDSGNEYIRITDRLGGKAHLNITNETNADVFMEVSRLVLNTSDASVRLPETLVKGEEELMRIADLFENRGGLYE